MIAYLPIFRVFVLYLSRDWLLRLTEDITFDDAPSPQNPPIHRDALIRCRVSSEPPPEVSWRFKNKRIEQSKSYFFLPDHRYAVVAQRTKTFL